MDIHFSDKAIENIGNMNNRVAVIGNAFGQSSEEYKLAARSLANVLANVIRLGNRIGGEDDLSLNGLTAYGMTYGVIWFKRRPRESDDPMMAEYYALCGEWSIHS
jgi:hypothetical protein